MKKKRNPSKHVFILANKTTSSTLFLLTFARKDNSLRINPLVGLLENWVTR